MRYRVLAALAAVTLAVTGCQDGGSTDPDSTGAPGAGQWTMPDLVGAGLQEAQDRIQELTDGQLLVTDSHDALGQDRGQVDDDNWKVCTQNVAAGTAITTDTRIDFGVVRVEESCP